MSAASIQPEVPPVAQEAWPGTWEGRIMGKPGRPIPDVFLQPTSADYRNGTDSILEAALQHLR